MRNHLHLLMKQRTSWKDTKPSAGRDGWVVNIGLWYGNSNIFNSGLKPWASVGESGAAQRFPVRIRSHLWVEENFPWMGPHLRRELVTIFGREVKKESSYQ